MVDLTSMTWTGPERLQWREQITPPLAIVSLFFCVLAAIIYYIFPRLRVFPRSILSWINFYNILFNAYLIPKWFPGSVAHKPLVVNLLSGSSYCRFCLFLDNFSINGLVACDTLIAVTLFLVLKMKVDLEDNQRYFREFYLLFAIGFPLTIGFTAAFGFSTATHLASPCVVSNPIGIALITYPSFILALIQFFLIIWAMIHVREVVNSVHSMSPNNFPLKYLVVRFMATFVAQLYNIFATQIYALFPSTNANAIFSRFAFISHANGGTVDALILIIGNVDFINWLKTIWPRNKTDVSSLPTTGSMSTIQLRNCADVEFSVTMTCEISQLDNGPAKVAIIH
eukprot:Phypoly_transcript_11117.p1 GENE.Phypoly_transcript_11117~~Phypoly_transcript_11117.p1  ORF type:complete len:340 (+),score=9.27 Phypoly_transcript_11117:118-1137(+)